MELESREEIQEFLGEGVVLTMDVIVDLIDEGKLVLTSQLLPIEEKMTTVDLIKGCKNFDLEFKFDPTEFGCSDDTKPDVDMIGQLFEDKFEPYDIKEIFLGDDPLSDDGEDVEDYCLINSELYKFELHLEVEWVGDWSVRANVPDRFNLTKLTKI